MTRAPYRVDESFKNINLIFVKQNNLVILTDACYIAARSMLGKVIIIRAELVEKWGIESSKST